MLYWRLFGLKTSDQRARQISARPHGSNPARKFAIMPGKTMMLTAKISGIMPAELTRSGMKVVLPPYCRPPRIRFAW